MKLISTVLAVVSTIGIATAAFADGNNYLDAETMAQGFLLHTVDHYHGTLNGYLADSNRTYLALDWYMDKNSYISNLTVNGTNIPIPASKPLSVLPIPSVGLRNTYIELDAQDAMNNTGSVGTTNFNVLNPGDPLTVIMFPNLPSIFIPVVTSDPNSLSLNLSGANGWGWYYDSGRGGIVVQLYQLVTTSVTYSVTDANGKIYARGTLQLFQGNSTPPPAGSIVNAALAGGVRYLQFGTNGWDYASNQKFDSMVTRNGSAAPAKVYVVQDGGNQSYMNVYLYDTTHGGTVEVRKWVSNGPMPLIPSTSTSDQYGNVTVHTTDYVDKAVITVMPSQTGSASDTFQIQISRW